MIAVSNTTPLRYLIAIGQDSLLDKLFEKVFVPPAVIEELTGTGTPEFIRQRVTSLPSWFEVCALLGISEESFPTNLHRGEREAILLAEQLQPDVLLIDDYVGRTIA